MYVHESGTPGSPAVVFLHGAGASGGMWREHMAKLAGFHCLAPDLPGFGRSNHLPFLSRTVTADLVAELIATRVPARRAHVVGLSWGGALAHTLLDRHPGLVNRAVIDGAGVLTWWGGGLILAGVTVVSPFLHTRPVTALFSGLIGMDEEGRADLRASSPPGVPARIRGGLHVRGLPRRDQRPVSDPARRRGEGDGGPTVQRGAGLPHAARGREVRARTPSRLDRQGAGAARPDGGGLAHRAGASLRTQARDTIARSRGATPP